MSREANKVIRAFEQALLLGPLQATLAAKRDGKTVEKILKLVFDHAKGIFKTAGENKIVKGDNLRLEDGRAFEVTSVARYIVDDVVCYLEVGVQALEGEPKESGVRRALDQTPPRAHRATGQFKTPSSGRWRLPSQDEGPELRK
jgi:hypothetical protein